MIILIIRFLFVILVAIFAGKLISKIRMPSILGWLLTGMILGPYAIGIVSNELLNADWYQTAIHIFEAVVGIMLGMELVFKNLKKSGKQIIVTTITQSLGTFLVVTACFLVIFYFMGIPLYISFIFGAIALATAPAPALSIVREFKTNGPVTKTLIPMAVLDDVLAIIIFFTIITIVSANGSEQSMPLYMTLLVMILLPIIIGTLFGFLVAIILKKEYSNIVTLILFILVFLISCIVGFIFNYLVLPEPTMNFLLIGMGFATAFVNILPKEKIEQVSKMFMPIIGISLMIVIVNLGIPLDYKLILGAGLFTLVYILSRGIGKYYGAFIGAKVTGLPKTVSKYLGLTLLPHSGVSLLFTGVAVSSLSSFDIESAIIIQGTISAAAVINEVIAVIVSKKAFEWAGEIDKSNIIIE